MKHKYADAIVAWAYGEKIQFRSPLLAEWIDHIDEPNERPNFDAQHVEWRPKPKKKKGWIAISLDGHCSRIYETDEALKKVLAKSLSLFTERWQTQAIIQIEFEEGEGLE